MTVGTETHVESWTIELPDDEAKCAHDDCSAAAVWRGSATCCGATGNACEPHKERFDILLSFGGTCGSCGGRIAVRWWRI